MTENANKKTKESDMSCKRPRIEGEQPKDASFQVPNNEGEPYDPIPVERVDLKRGYCFVFLQDVTSEEDKRRIESFVSIINGM